MQINVDINGTKVTGILDTGADCSSASQSLAADLKLPLYEIVGIVKSQGINGEETKLSHWTACDLVLNSSPPLTVRQSLFIHPKSPVPLLLGRDFLNLHGCEINRMGNELWIGDHTIPFSDPPNCICSALDSIRIHVMSAVTSTGQQSAEEGEREAESKTEKECPQIDVSNFLPHADPQNKVARSYSSCIIEAGHEAMIRVVPPELAAASLAYCLEGTLHATSKGIAVAGTLFDTDTKEVYARVSNVTQSWVTVPKDFPLCICSPVIVIDDLEFRNGMMFSSSVFQDLQTQIPDIHPDDTGHCMHQINDRLKNSDHQTSNEVLAAESPAPSEPDLTREQFLRLIQSAIPDHLDHQQRVHLFDVLYKYSNVFSKHKDEVGHYTGMKHSIPVYPGTEPISMPPRRFAPQKRRIIREIVQKYKEMGIVRDSQSPWSCPVVLVMRKDGSARLCCDWRRLNDVTIKDRHPLPLVSDVLDGLGRSKWFTKLDFTNGYYHIDLDDDAIQKSAFVTAEGLYEFTKMGMGLVSSPATFVRMVTQVLGNLLWNRCMAYLDDVLVYSETWEQHLFDLSLVLAKLLHANLKLKPSKCSFASKRMDYLGFIVDQDGLHPDPAKIEKMVSYPRPKDVKGVQRFLGLVNYYRKFVPHFASIAKPLYRLLEKETPWNWNKECQDAFENLKTAMASEPVLAFPDFSKPFIVSTDASQYAIGCILKQLGRDGKEHVIQYGSKALNPAQQRYSTIEREGLAIKYATVLFRPYLFGNQFTVYTDHKPLTGLLKSETTNERLAKWKSEFQNMDMKIVYRPGKDNADADAMSRITSAWEEISFDAEESCSSIPPESPPTPSQAVRLLKYMARTVQKVYLSVHKRVETAAAVFKGVKALDKSKEKEGENVFTAVNLLPFPDYCYGDSPRMTVSDSLSRQSSCPQNSDHCFLQMHQTTISDSLFCLELDCTPMFDAGIPQSITADALQALQRSENWSKRLMSLLESPESQLPAKMRRLIRHYELMNGLLFRKLENEIIPRRALIIPSSLRAEVLYRAHDVPTSGHLGVEKTWRRLRLECYWPGMYKDTVAYVLSCELCGLSNTNRQPLFGSLQSIPPATHFFQRVHMDKFGPVQNSARNNNHAFVAVDACTRYKIAAASNRGRSEEAGNFLLHNLILKYGPMKELVSDNGPENIGPEVLALCQLYNIQHTFTSSRMPQSNGLVEIANGSVTECIRTLVKRDHTNWDILLDHVVLALNTAVHDVTGFSPHFLVFGQEANAHALLPLTDKLPVNDSHSWEDAHAARQIAIKIANERTERRNRRSEDRYNARHRTDLSALYPGRRVYIETSTQIVGLSKRFCPRFSSPVTIIGPADSPVVFWVEDDDKNQYQVHCKRMKLCHERPVSLIPKRHQSQPVIQKPPTKKPRARQRKTTIEVIPDSEELPVALPVKRGRGRPRKTSVPESQAPKPSGQVKKKTRQ
jgi:transposase InsO family protein